MTSRQTFRRCVGAMSLILALLSGCGGDDGESNSPVKISDIRTLSSRADMVSGGSALVEVVLPAGISASFVKVRLNGADVSSQFAVRSDGRFVGLVSGMNLGKNTLDASAVGGPLTTLALENHSIGGPLISGPQIVPWICEPENSGLGHALDSQCNAPAKVDYLYVSTNPALQGYQTYDPSSPPTDVAKTTIDGGKVVPYIVRREIGTANRGIYAIAVIADPLQTVTPFQPPTGWNKKLYYAFFGGALPQHRQGPAGPYDTPSTLVLSNPLQIGRGYAVVASTLTALGVNSNTVVSAETVMMLKEQVTKSFGEIAYTLSNGSSGGSIQQMVLANAYPGLLDGVQPSFTFPDLWSVNTEAQDCSLLIRYFDASPSLWTNAVDQNNVWLNANLLPGTCRAWHELYNLDVDWGNPSSASCYVTDLVGVGIPAPWMYDPVLNPLGARCTLQDYQINVFGSRKTDGFANRPYDNVGVQYGLKAFNTGQISAEQFVDMNEKVGGRDIDGNWIAQRSVADPTALTVLYRTGQLNNLENLGGTPLVDSRVGCSSAPSGAGNSEIHSCFHSYELRDRLKKSTGTLGSAVLLLDAPDDTYFDVLDAWVAGIKADKGTDSQAAKVIRNRPAGAVDACWVNGVKVTDAAACSASNPYYGDPRMGAGDAISSAIIKCQLAPLNRSSYLNSLSDAQWTRLQVAFPSGVCDWSQPGVGATSLVPWLTFATGPGGPPLGSPPSAQVPP